MNLNKTLTTIILGLTLSMGCVEKPKIPEMPKESITFPEGFCLQEQKDNYSFDYSLGYDIQNRVYVVVDDVDGTYGVGRTGRSGKMEPLCYLGLNNTFLIDLDCDHSVDEVMVMSKVNNWPYQSRDLQRKQLDNPELFDELDKKMSVSYATACENVLLYEKQKVGNLLNRISQPAMSEIEKTLLENAKYSAGVFNKTILFTSEDFDNNPGDLVNNWMIIKNKYNEQKEFEIVPSKSSEFESTKISIKGGEYQIVPFSVSANEGRNRIQVNLNDNEYWFASFYVDVRHHWEKRK